MEQLKAGSEVAFTQLYRHYSERIYYNVLSLVKDEFTAEELVQDIFSKLWQKKESIIIKSSFTGYLFTVSRNRVYDFFQQLNRNEKLYAHIRAIASESYVHVEEVLLAKENEDILQKTIASLPPQRRRVFELCKIQGLSYQQASDEMNLSLSTIKDHMAKARVTIKAFVSNNPDLVVYLLLFVHKY